MADVLEVGGIEDFGEDNEREVVVRAEGAAMDEDDPDDNKIKMMKDKAKKRKGRGFDSRLGDRVKDGDYERIEVDDSGSNIKKPLVLWSSVSTNDTPSFHEFI